MKSIITFIKVLGICLFTMSFMSVAESSKFIGMEFEGNIASANRIIIDDRIPLLDQLIKSNSIYEIVTAIDLNGKTISIPKNSCLFFNGGSVTNGTIVGDYTRIVAPFGQIFGNNVKLNGSFTSEYIKMSWWITDGLKDNTKEVQAAFDATMYFDNRIIYFDIPVHISDVSLALKYSPGIILVGGSNSYQNSNIITVFGKGSHGIDISGTENLQFRNLQFVGEKDNAPVCFLYASRLSENKQCPGHKFNNVNFRGYATKAFVYNYAGESWSFSNCSFRVEPNASIAAAYYATTLNSLGERTKYGMTEESVTPLTVSEFNSCSFNIKTFHPAVLYEGGVNKQGIKKNITSIYFTKCYFFCEFDSSVKMINVTGNVAFINCVDESGAMDTNSRGTAFLDFSGKNELDGLTLINNTFYAKNNTKILNATNSVKNYNAYGNKVINKGGEWHFNNLTNAYHYGLSTIENFSVNNATSVNVITNDGRQSNVSIGNEIKPVLGQSDEGRLYYDKRLKKIILWDGLKWVNVDGSKL